MALLIFQFTTNVIGLSAFLILNNQQLLTKSILGNSNVNH